jgi:hypothetical protein
MAPAQSARSSSPDPIRRRAAIIATLVAVPIALTVLLVSVFVFGGPGPEPEPAATGPVTMTERDLSPEAFGLCQAVISDLPDTTAGQARRPVTAGSEQNAAYGDPPILVECGTELPAVGDTDLVFPISGVCWYSVTEADRTVWTTVDRTVAVTVTVPGPPDGAAQVVAPFSTAIGTNLPLREVAPTGCSGPVPTAT